MQLNPITFEVLHNALGAMCDEGSEMIARLAYAPTISEGHDHSCALLTAEGRLVAHGDRDQAPHIGSFEPSVRVVREWTEDKFDPGDVYIFNDPYSGGIHTNDVKLIRPIFHDGKVIAFNSSTGHWPDVGGALPGSFNPRATDCYSEGLRMPPMLLFRGEEIDRTVMTLIEYNMRTGRERIADIYAQHQAGKLIEERLCELYDRHGSETIETLFTDVFDYTEEIFRKQVAELPDGEFEFEDFSDMDVMHPDTPRIRVHCRMTIKGDQVTFDYRGSDGAPVGPFGFPRASLETAVYDGTLHCFPQLERLNHGLARSIEVLSTPGSCVHILEPTPASGYASGAYEKVAAVTMACWANAFSSIDPRRMYAAGINLANLCIGGIHPKTGKQFVNYLWNEGGQGARSYKDGNPFQMMIFIGGATNQPIEILERWYPLLYTHCMGVVDSCGDGKFRGGVGIDRSFKVLGPLTMTMHGDRAEVTPFGLAGGTNGGANILRLRRAANPDVEEELGMHAVGIRLEPGDHLTYRSNGGGGFGHPLERDPERVLADVELGWISEAKAREVYGVILEADGPAKNRYTIDQSATAQMRAKLAHEPRVRGYGPGEVHPLGEMIQIAEVAMVAE
jgi:N-methylhydantoinase B